MLIEQVMHLISKEEENRPKSSPLRMSSAGHCQRKIAYLYHGYEVEPTPPRAIMVFRLGDKIETEIKDLLIKYPPNGYEISTSNDEISFEINGHKITGHIDGLITKPSKCILEIKSINTMKFKQLDKTGIPIEYQFQATAYMKALDVKETLFIFYNKDTSHMKEIFFCYDDYLWQQIVNRFSAVISSTKENLPDREYSPDSSGRLPWQCSYCPVVKHCWPEAELTFDKNNKPSLWINKMKGSQYGT